MDSFSYLLGVGLLLVWNLLFSLSKKVGKRFWNSENVWQLSVARVLLVTLLAYTLSAHQWSALETALKFPFVFFLDWLLSKIFLSPSQPKDNPKEERRKIIRKIAKELQWFQAETWDAERYLVDNPPPWTKEAYEKGLKYFAEKHGLTVGEFKRMLDEGIKDMKDNIEKLVAEDMAKMDFLQKLRKSLRNPRLYIQQPNAYNHTN